MEAAAIRLNGEAPAWFQWEDHRRPLRGWDELKLWLLDRFSQTQVGSSCEKFLALQRETAIREYRRVSNPWCSRR